MPIALVKSSVEKAWHRERARRVTKSRAVQLINPSIATFKRIHGEQSFKGNRHTERGHKLEPMVEAWVEKHLGIPKSQILYAHPDNPMHAATPDCALEDEGEWSLVEIKTTKEDWSAGLPRKIIRDALWQKYVMGAGWAAVVWWQVDDLGQPLTLEPTVEEITDDPYELQRMIDGANAYLAWVDAGCPDTDDDTGLPLDIVEAIELVNIGRAAEKHIRAWCEKNGEAVSKTLPVGSIRFDVSETTEFDKAAFLAAEKTAAGTIAAAAKLLKSAQADPTYRKPTVSTKLTISAPKEAKVAA